MVPLPPSGTYSSDIEYISDGYRISSSTLNTIRNGFEQRKPDLMDMDTWLLELPIINSRLDVHSLGVVFTAVRTLHKKCQESWLKGVTFFFRESCSICQKSGLLNRFLDIFHEKWCQDCWQKHNTWFLCLKSVTIFCQDSWFLLRSLGMALSCVRIFFFPSSASFWFWLVPRRLCVCFFFSIVRRTKVSHDSCLYFDTQLITSRDVNKKTNTALRMKWELNNLPGRCEVYSRGIVGEMGIKISSACKGDLSDLIGCIRCVKLWQRRRKRPRLPPR